MRNKIIRAIVQNIAEKIIFLSQNVIRIENINNLQKEELERKLYKREFYNLFQAEFNKIISEVNLKVESQKDRLSSMEKGLQIKQFIFDVLDLQNILEVANSKLDNSLIKNINTITDLEHKLGSRPTLEHIETLLDQNLSKFDSEMTTKFSNKLKQFDYREEIMKLLAPSESLPGQISYCLEQVKKMQEVNTKIETQVI